MMKINNFKNDALKVERVPKIVENLNSFETMLKLLKTMQTYLKKRIFWIFVLFRYFWIFQKFYQIGGSKIG